MADLKQLRSAVTAADCGSFSSAADRLGVEVSVISRRIRDLEDALGVALFERVARGVRLTDAGRSYIASARDILGRLAQADVDARSAATGINGRLDVAFVWSFGSGPIVELMRRFQGENGSVEVRTFERGDDALLSGLETHQFDVIVTAIVDPLHPRWAVIKRLCRQELWLERLVVVMPETAHSDGVKWDDLTDRLILCRREDDWLRFTNHVRALGGPPLSFSEQDVALDSLVGLVAAGIGWCVLPESAARQNVDCIKVLPIISNGAALRVEAFWRPGASNPALTRFVALARRIFPKIGPD